MRNKKLILEIIILILGALCLSIGYYFYDLKVLQPNEKLNKINASRNSEEERHDELIKEEQIENEYLKSVPFKYENQDNGKDAYQEKLVTINDISDSVLLSYAVSHLDKNLVYTDLIPIKDKNEDRGFQIKASDLKKIIDEKYNIDFKSEKNFLAPTITSDGFVDEKIAGKGFEYIKEYDIYEGFSTQSEERNVHLSRNIKQENVQNDMTITEQFGIIRVKNGVFYLLKKQTDTVENSIYSNESESKVEKYFEKNSEKFPIYKHTFKKDKFSNYYWYSTELIKK